MLEATEVSTQIVERIYLFLWSFIIGLVCLFFASRQGLLNSFSLSRLPYIRGFQVLFGFVFILFSEIIVYVIGTSNNALINNQIFFSENEKLWLVILGLLASTITTIMTLFILNREQRVLLFKQDKTPWYVNIFKGMVVCFLSFPLIAAFNAFLSIITLYFYGIESQDQAAVKLLKEAMAYPLVFKITVFKIMVTIPFIEEFLFRGLLQNWLKRVLKYPILGVIVASLVFACFHYSKDQGINNIEIISTIFFVGCILGFLYERQRSLWASIGFHSIFNMIGILNIYLFKG